MKTKDQLALTAVTAVLILMSMTYCYMGWFTKHNATYVHDSTTETQNLVPYHLHISKPLNFSLKNFLSKDILENPDEANKLSPLLTTKDDVINEAQRIQMKLFRSLLGKYKYAMLFNYSPSENKGDSAICVGEFKLLRKLNIDLIFSCAIMSCTKKIVKQAQAISQNYTDKELVILLQGGGDVIGWKGVDIERSVVISHFKNFNIIMFPQGILYIKNTPHINFCKKAFGSHSRLTFIWRDKVSYRLGKELFPKVRSLLSPDMAFQLGHIRRFMEPTHDMIWLKRKDKESPEYTVPLNATGYRIHVSDWLQWKTPNGESAIENAFLRLQNGLMFIQRGRVVITDRLHGHILSTLLGIPHVYIDNKHNKISNYRNTWTAGIENVIRANSSSDALNQAIKLLKKLSDVYHK